MYGPLLSPVQSKSPGRRARFRPVRTPMRILQVDTQIHSIDASDEPRGPGQDVLNIFYPEFFDRNILHAEFPRPGKAGSRIGIFLYTQAEIVKSLCFYFSVFGGAEATLKDL